MIETARNTLYLLDDVSYEYRCGLQVEINQTIINERTDI